jgi:hypothetical protein
MNRRRLSGLCSLSIGLALVCSPVALADLSWAYGSADAYLIQAWNVDNLSFTNPSSLALVTVYELPSGLWDSDSSSVPAWSTGVAKSLMYTYSSASALGIGSIATSTGTFPPNNGYGEAWSEAEQSFDFTAAAAGPVAFLLWNEVNMHLNAGSPDGYASGTMYIRAEIGNSDGSLASYAESEVSKTVPDFVFGNSYDTTSSEYLAVGSTWSFAEGEVGHFRVQMDNDVYASSSVVPVPAAVLLGLLGLSTAGVGLRRSREDSR